MAWVSVEGVVSRVHGSGNGFGVKESWEVAGKERSRFWAVFPKDQVRVSVGDRVKVSGGLQTSVTDPKPDSQGVERVYVDHVVGQARVDVSQAARGGSDAGSQPQWASATPAHENGSQGGFGDGDFGSPF